MLDSISKIDLPTNAVMMKTARTLQIFAHALLFSAVVDSVIPTRNFINVVSNYIKVITYFINDNDKCEFIHKLIV